jgi:hypothetical protein
MDDEDSDTSSLDGMLDDKLRVVYYKGYLAAVAQAIKWVTSTIISYCFSFSSIYLDGPFLSFPLTTG